MPLTYIRQDADLTITTTGGELEFELRVGAAVHQFKTGTTLLDSVTGLASALVGWTPLLGAVNRSGTDVVLPRMVVHAREPRLAAVEWEDVLGRLRAAGAVSQKLVVTRATEVLARSLSRRFDFPARVLEVGAPARVGVIARQLLGRARNDYALLVGNTSLLAAERTVALRRWPSVDILHVQAAAARDARRRTKQTDPGGLEWLFRLADRWEVRLIVVEALPADAGALRQAAQRLVDRGGPAILMLASSSTNTLELYRSLLHDRPLDWCQRQLSNSAFFGGGGRREAVRFSQIGLGLTSPERRSALRHWITLNTRPPEDIIVHGPLKPSVVSKVVREAGEDLGLKYRSSIRLQTDWQRLIRFNDIISTRLMDYGYALHGFETGLPPSYRGKTVPLSSIASYVMKRAVPLHPTGRRKSPVRLDTLLTERLDSLERLMGELVFDNFESEGTLPLATTATELRKLVSLSVVKGERPATPPPRHVTVEFYSWKESGAPALIAQAGARLTPGAVVHLGVKIGAMSLTTFSIGEMIFADAAIDWKKEKQGVWLEVGITGIDFDVLGDPVQPVWLPAMGDTTLATFAVRPRSQTRVPGVARVRVTLFYRNNVVQSFLVAAAVTTSDGDVRGVLAKALSVKPAAVRDGVGYIARQEYSAIDPNAVSTLGDRTLSIVANESAGEKIFSVKGEDVFSTNVNANVRPHVTALRAALTAASHGQLPEEYRYDDDNNGKASELFDLLWNLASSGWELWSNLVPSAERQEEIRKLLGDGGVVTAAHVDLAEVVPWSLIYDREVSPAKQYSPDWTAQSPVVYDVERALCEVALPAANGSMPAVACGADPKCPLHKSAVAARQALGKTVLPESVICPRHFWGFMHRIEVPVQQTPKTAETAETAETAQTAKTAQTAQSSAIPAVQTVVEAVGPVRIVAGFNDHVDLAGDNRTSLAGVAAKAQAALTEATKGKVPRDAFVQTLKQLQPDLVYLYCHAWPETLQQRSVPHPNLDFGERLVDDIAFANNFSGPRWQHRPLVFLNACGTVGFTPLAPAEFITQFIQGRFASAVIGTEVTVWARLAHEVGWKFCEAFLAGHEAGATLLTIRRQLLHKNNPLGLVYTIYGSAGLRLVNAGPKVSQRLPPGATK